MRITKRVREEAVLLCAIAASNDWKYDQELGCYHGQPDQGSDAGKLAWQAERLAYSAWQDRDDWTPETHWAEAEALLRTGWEP